MKNTTIEIVEDAGVSTVRINGVDIGPATVALTFTPTTGATPDSAELSPNKSAVLAEREKRLASRG